MPATQCAIAISQSGILPTQSRCQVPSLPSQDINPVAMSGTQSEYRPSHDVRYPVRISTQSRCQELSQDINPVTMSGTQSEYRPSHDVKYPVKIIIDPVKMIVRISTQSRCQVPSQDIDPVTMSGT